MPTACPVESNKGCVYLFRFLKCLLVIAQFKSALGGCEAHGVGWLEWFHGGLTSALGGEHPNSPLEKTLLNQAGRW